MNGSEKDQTFVRACKVAEASNLILSQFPNVESRGSRIAVLVVNCVLLCSTITLNGISVITIRKSSQLKSKVCYFVILLQSVVDLAVGLMGIPLFIHYLLVPFLDNVDCILIIVGLRITQLTCALSVVTLSALTLERYIGVVHPYYYETNVTKKRILAYVCGGIVVLVLPCTYSFQNRAIARSVVMGIKVVFFVFTVFVYARIYVIIRRLVRSERRPACENNGNQHTMKKQIIRESRYARSCFIVVACFFVFLLPPSMSPILFADGSFNYNVYFNWSITLMISNSSINSVIFFWTKTLLRKEALKILKSLCCQPPA